MMVPEQHGHEQWRVSIAGPFTVADLNRVRQAVAQQCMRWQLPPEASQALQAVASELAANVVVHAAGDGNLLLSHRGGFVYCQSVDRGPGMARPYLAGWTAPSNGDSAAGLGLWMVRMLSTSLYIDSSSLGTTVTAALRVRRD